MEITKETLIGDLLNENPGYATVLSACGMHCVFCPSAAGESLEMACAVHGMDVEKVLEGLQNYDKENA
ncbi:MAG: DUF1858 domain-containing protein [Oscillospiraceae bacterium]|nr:DUF1858 domain-containing protein [Oscillospiraceae bacterium]